MTNSFVKVVEVNTEEVLFTCSVEDAQKAYTRAAEYEEMGLDIEVRSPSLPETLAHTLGAPNAQIEELKQEMENELDSHHSDTCCFKA